MTAYYLHMANHQKYKYMELSPEEFRASNRSNIINSPAKSANTLERTKMKITETPAAPPGRPTSVTLTPVSKTQPSFSPAVVKGLTRSHSFVQGVSKGSTAGPRAASFTQSKMRFQQVRTTPVSKVAPSAVSKPTSTPRMKGVRCLVSCVHFNNNYCFSEFCSSSRSLPRPSRTSKLHICGHWSRQVLLHPPSL